MKILTLNLWNLNNDWPKRCSIIEAFLVKTDPDLVFLQEVSHTGIPPRPQFEDFSKSPRWREYSVYCKSGYWKQREEGLAILSALPVSQISSLQLPLAPNDMPRQLMTCCIAVGGTKIRVANTHLAYALDADCGRVAQVEQCLHYLRSLTAAENIPMIFAGDFNSVPGSPPIERVLGDNIGFRDVFEELNSQPNIYTFCASNPLVDPELGANRWIDYVFVSSGVRVKSAQRVLDQSNADGGWASDHFGLLADIQIEKWR